MKDLLKRLFNEPLKAPKEEKDKVFSDEQRQELGEAVKIFWKSAIWLKVLQPYIEDKVIAEASNMFTNGIGYSNEDKNQVITAVRLALGLKDELKKIETEGDLAKERLHKSGRPGASQSRRR